MLESPGFVVVAFGLGDVDAAGATSGGGVGTDGFGMSLFATAADPEGRKSLIGMTPWYVRTEYCRMESQPTVANRAPAHSAAPKPLSALFIV